MSVARLVVAVLILVGLSGCGGSEGGQPSSADNEGETSTGPENSESDEPDSDDDSEDDSEDDSDDESSSDAAGDPCGLLSEDDLATSLGQSLGEGRQSSGANTSQDLSWSSVRCTWGEAESLELRLSVSDADSFEDGVLQCPEPAGIVAEVTQVSGIGTQAWWEWDDFSGAEGLLRVCTETALLDIALQAPDGDSAGFQAQATDVATIVLAQL